jgi:predicted ABC-type ATPase
MYKPNLIVIAGCNGSGKSTYSQALLPDHIQLFDADKRKQELYNAFKFDSELRDQMAWNKTQNEFEELVSNALTKKKDFAYETNFNADPLFWIDQFKKAGFEIHLIYFCLKNTTIAKERVAIRFENGGHYVADQEVENRYRLGFENLNSLHDNFDTLLLLESSQRNQLPRTILHFKKGSTHKLSLPVPRYLVQKCPNLFKYLRKGMKKNN